jgi:hypothetical protein
VNFICAVSHYPNCRVHDAGYYSKVMFFSKFSELLEAAWRDAAYFEYHDVYSPHGEVIGEFQYEFSSHVVSGLSFEGAQKWRIEDDGHGNKVWRAQ